MDCVMGTVVGANENYAVGIPLEITPVKESIPNASKPSWSQTDRVIMRLAEVIFALMIVGKSMVLLLPLPFISPEQRASLSDSLSKDLTVWKLCHPDTDGLQKSPPPDITVAVSQKKCEV